VKAKKTSANNSPRETAKNNASPRQNSSRSDYSTMSEKQKLRQNEREELDFTSSRYQSESDKQRLIEERRRPLIQDLFAIKGSKSSLGSRSKSQGDSLDAEATLKRKKRSKKRSGSREDLLKKEVEVIDLENPYDEVSLGATSSTLGVGVPSAFSDSQDTLEPPETFKSGARREPIYEKVRPAASTQTGYEPHQRTKRSNKRVRNRSLEMVLDDNSRGSER